jgi:hypothetical protein
MAISEVRRYGLVDRTKHPKLPKVKKVYEEFGAPIFLKSSSKSKF